VVREVRENLNQLQKKKTKRKRSLLLRMKKLRLSKPRRSSLKPEKEKDKRVREGKELNRMTYSIMIGKRTTMESMNMS